MRRSARKTDSVCSSESPRGFAFYVAQSMKKSNTSMGRRSLLKRKKREREVGVGKVMDLVRLAPS